MAVHSWMPASPCDDGCIDRKHAQVGDGTFALRLAAVAGLLVSFPVANVAAPRKWRHKLQRRYAAGLLHCCGISLKIVDNRDCESPGAKFAEEGDGLLVVSPHIGWTDVLVLGSVQPVSFVARGDLVDWPLLGALARKMRVIPIDRAKLRSLPGVVDTIAARIRAGERITAFPEGTTWCGRAYGTLRPALFQAAIDTGTAVQPVRLQYLDPDGGLSTSPCFVGAETMVGSLLRMLRSTGVTAEVVLAPVESPGTDRRDLAARCERAVRGEVRLDFADHGVLESAGQRNAGVQGTPVPSTVAVEDVAIRIA